MTFEVYPTYRMRDDYHQRFGNVRFKTLEEAKQYLFDSLRGFPQFYDTHMVYQCLNRDGAGRNMYAVLRSGGTMERRIVGYFIIESS
jgi:hypothetical protein